METLCIDPLFVIINQPRGLLSVPGQGLEKQECAVNRIKSLFPDCIDQHATSRPAAPVQIHTNPPGLTA